MKCNCMLTIGDIATVFDGPHATPKKIESGPYFLSISSLENGKLDLSKSAHLSHEDFIKWTRRVTPEAGDILFSYETRLGEVAMMPAGVTACLGRRMGLLRPDRTKILPEYLLYAYQSKAFQEIIRAKTIHGATVDRISLTELPSYPIQVPPLKTQQQIVDILKGYDQKLILNSEKNQTLEQMAQAIFKSWFVDFDPVRAKMNGEQPEGMDATTAALFPDKLVESELGLIPDRWSEQPLGHFIDFMTGFAFKSQQFTETGVRLARGDNVKEGKFYWGDKSRFWPEVTSELDKYYLKSGDILIGMDGSKVGKNWVRVNESDLPCLLVQRVARLRDKGLIGSSMLEVIIGGNKFKQYVENVKTGTSIPHISGKQIKEMPIIFPNDGGKLFQRFEDILRPLAQKREVNNAENQELAKLRDTLLPKLLSGEIELDGISMETP